MKHFSRLATITMWLSICAFVSTLSWASGNDNSIGAFLGKITAVTTMDCSKRCGKYNGDVCAGRICSFNCNDKKKQYTCTTNPAPSVPTNVKATAASPTSITVTWTAVSGATSYTVYGGTASGSLAQIGTSASATFTHNNLTAATTYYYAVDAKNASGTSAKSATVNAKTQSAAPAVPGGLSSGTVTNNSIVINWTTVTGATAYLIYAGTSASSLQKVDSVTTNNYTYKNLSSNTQYFFAVSSVNASGKSELTVAINATTQPAVSVHKLSNRVVSTGTYDVAAYLPNGKSAGTLVNYTTGAANQIINDLGLAPGTYQLVIRDARTRTVTSSSRITVLDH